MHGVVHRRMCSVSGPGRTLTFMVFSVMLMTAPDTISSLSTDSPLSPAAAPASTTSSVTCEVARMKCAFRVGCGMALQNYMVGCADVMSGRISRCSDLCKKSLIALTSTEEGQDLMRCDCQGQEFCDSTKQRIEICRPEVMRANEEHSVVSCSVAQWICAADPLCSTALEYYRRLCRSMFHGKKCTLRCNNSISILNRQEKAAKLKSCVCDGSEDYDCDTIMRNMNRLCFHKPASSGGGHGHQQHPHLNEIQGDSPTARDAKSSRRNSAHNAATAACAQSSAAAATRTRFGHSIFVWIVALAYLGHVFFFGGRLRRWTWA